MSADRDAAAGRTNAAFLVLVWVCGAFPGGDRDRADALEGGNPGAAKGSPRLPAQPCACISRALRAASFLESFPARPFDGLTLSNILDGTNPSYWFRLMRAVRRAATDNAVVILRSFAEPGPQPIVNHARRDRSMLWGVLDIRDAQTVPDLQLAGQDRAPEASTLTAK